MIIAYNQTEEHLLFKQLSVPNGVLLPSTSIILTDFNKIYEIQSDEELKNYVSIGKILIDIGDGILTKENSLLFFDSIFLKR